MRARVWQVATFALEPFRGNPAFVVGLDEDLPAEVLRSIGGLFCGLWRCSDPIGATRCRFASLRRRAPTPARHAAAAAAAVVLKDRSEVEVSFEDRSRRLFRRDDHGRVVVPGR